MTRLLSSAGIEKPQTLYLEENQYSAALEEEILRAGYTVLIHHGEEGLPRMAVDAEGELWRLGARPWNYRGVQEQITELVGAGGAICFTVSFAEGQGVYNAHSFDNMLSFVEPYLTSGSLQVTDLEQARPLHDPARNGKRELEASWRAENESLTEQIRALEEQIQAVYAGWNGD